MEIDLEELRKPRTASGFKFVKVTNSNKFQPWLKDPKTGEQRGLGSFETAEEAAKVVVAALRDGVTFDGPPLKRNKRGTVRARPPTPHLPSLCLIH